jgi:uncharacterized protein involved in exopolysaccharide biosynthesis
VRCSNLERRVKDLESLAARLANAEQKIARLEVDMRVVTQLG